MFPFLLAVLSSATMLRLNSENGEDHEWMEGNGEINKKKKYQEIDGEWDESLYSYRHYALALA